MICFSKAHANLRAGFILLLFLLPVLIPAEATGQTDDRDRLLPDRPYGTESVISVDPQNRDGETSSAGLTESFPAFLSHSHGQSHHERDKIIHLTDYLYQIPEIKEAYEAWLSMKKEAPDDLLVMQETAGYETGDTLSFYVYNIEESNAGSPVYDNIVFELRKTGERSEIWVEQDEYEPGKIDEAVVDLMMETLEERTPERSVNSDQGIILNNIDIFAKGDPGLVPDPDGSGKVKILISDIQDGWSPDEGGGFTAGFFNPGDLAPVSSNRYSNEAAILYINSYPGIYTDTRPADPDLALNTVAHEFQHLIQAGKGNLITFMDEGQSEMAEVFNGFDARSMVFLSIPEEVSGDVESQANDAFLRWRRGEQEVLKDYQRAQLFHGYLYERAGLEALGSLTQSASARPWTQYQRILNDSGESLEFRDVLSEFYVANWVNDVEFGDGSFGYSLPQFSGARVTNPARRYDSGDRPWVKDESVALRYGGAKYTQWRIVEDLTIRLETPSEIHHTIITEDEAGNREVISPEQDEITMDGAYSSVVLVSVNTVVESTSSYGSREYTYSAEWTPRELRVVDISYSVEPVAGFIPIPFEYSEDRVFRGVGVRLDPEYDGVLEGVDFDLRHSDDAIQGEGTLSVNIAESQHMSGSGPEALFVASEGIATVNIDFEDLTTEQNSVDFSEFDIELETGTNYHIYFQVFGDSDDAALQFMFDQGSDDEDNPNYYPVRTLLAAFDGEQHTGWSRLLGDEDNDQDNDNKNLVMTTRMLSEAPRENGFPEIPVSDRFELLGNYPNPFNSETSFRINVPVEVEDQAAVRIELYDVLGRRVAVILDDELQSGIHTVSYNVENLASGVYIARLRSGNEVDSHKITLIK